MASLTHFFLLSLSVLSLLASSSNVQPSPDFYARSCPNLQAIVRSTMRQALAGEARLGASILRLFFLDCFVSGCDAGILLDDTARNFTGEKEAYSNQSARCYEVIDAIKTKVEAACNCTLSCADILALAAVEGVTHATVGAFTFPSSIAHLLRLIPLRHGGLGNLIRELTGIVEKQFVGSSPLVENSARTWTFIASKLIYSYTRDVISGSLACTVLISFLISRHEIPKYVFMIWAIWVVSYVMNNGQQFLKTTTILLQTGTTPQVPNIRHLNKGCVKKY